jgi:uncharacterized coiled-coil DUF342 family protein
MPEFQFRAPQRTDVHPLELVVQSVVGESLEVLATHLQTVHESQVVLIARIKAIDEKVKRWKSQADVDVDVKDMEDRLLAVKKRLKAVLEKLDAIETRVKSHLT